LIASTKIRKPHSPHFNHEDSLYKKQYWQHNHHFLQILICRNKLPSQHSLNMRAAMRGLSKSLNCQSIQAISKSVYSKQVGIYRTSSNVARTEYEKTNLKNYLQHKYDTEDYETYKENMFVLSYAGSRVLELSMPNTPKDIERIINVDKYLCNEPVLEGQNVGGNVLSLSLVTKLQSRLENYQENTAVQVVFFSSRSNDLFSGGLFSDIEKQEIRNDNAVYKHRLKLDNKAWHMSYMNGEPAEQAVVDDEMEKRKINDTFNFEVDYTSSISVDQIEAINKLALSIIKHKKITIATYGGVVAGTAYSTFAGSNYRLGTKSTVFYIPELARGVIPVGGLAYHLANCTEEGVAIARYLAVTEYVVRVHEMYYLGLISHLVEEAPYKTIAEGLSDTTTNIEPNGFNDYVETLKLHEILETMDINCDVDPSASPLWDKLLTVPLRETPMMYKDKDGVLQEDASEQYHGKAHDPTAISGDDLDFIVHIPAIEDCFKEDNITTCISKLHALKTEFGSETAKKLETLFNNDPQCVEEWFKITRAATSKSLEDIYTMEVAANSILLKSI